MSDGSALGSFSHLPADEPYPGVVRKSFDTARATVTQYVFEPGASFPRHRHPSEQITLVARGEVVFTIDGESHVMHPGDWAVTPSDVEHGATAGPDGATFVAVVSPARSAATDVVVAPSRAVAILPAGRGAGHELDLVEGEGRAWAVVWPGTGAEQRSLHVLELGAGARTRELCHPSEAVYYVTDGAGTVHGEGVEIALVPGSMVHCQPDAPYRFRADDALRLVGGPCPADPALYRPSHREDSTRLARRGAVRVFHRDEASAMLPMIAKDARLVVWPGVGAHAANMNYVAMAAGEQNEPHEHPDSEDTLFVLEGRGSIEDLANGVTLTFEAGDVVHVPRGVRHRVRADRGSGITSVGGPCPPDLALLRAAGLLDDPPAA